MQTNVDPDNPMAGMQKYMMYIVPFFSLTGLYWQYGLVLYWVTTNLWTLGQQYFMFRNWTVEPAGATAAAAGAPARAAQSRAAQSPPRPAPAGPKNGTTSSAKTATSGTKSASAPKAAAAGSTATAASNGRSSTSRPAAASTASGRVRTGSATRDAAANASGPPNGQNGAAKRGLLRLGRPKQEAVAEPEVPTTKVVRQQPVRQARSKRSGKR
jgi:YidC/Oxa1 family membrane protein insertase